MFSIFVYLFSAVISFWAGRYFFLLWKKNKYDPYWEFAAFFILLGMSFIIYASPFLISVFFISGALAAEVGNFLTFYAFTFMLRTFAKFQGIQFLSNQIYFFVVFFAVIKFVIGLLFPALPEFSKGLIYWHYPMMNYIAFNTLILLFTTTMAVTFLYNIKNIRTHKNQILYLGIAFLTGGIGGSFIVTFNSFFLLSFGYIFLFFTFLLIALFLITSRHRSE